MNSVLLALAWSLSSLSLLAFGGGNTIIPELQRQVVDVHHWMDASEFSALFALVQAAPGPNLMIVPMVGWHVAGWSGLLVASIAKFGPSSLLAMAVLRLWHGFKDRPWRTRIQAGVMPVTVGLTCASAVLLTESCMPRASYGWIVAGCAVFALRGAHPLWLLAGGAVAGLACGPA